MGAIRALLLAASQNKWLRERSSRYAFVRKSVSRFMPGETLDDALRAARELESKGIETILTHLGENVLDAQESRQVAQHYLNVLERIHSENLGTEISVKPTQLGLELSTDLCDQNLRQLLAAEDEKRTLWIDMEASGYVEATLQLYRKLVVDYPNAGICLQAYLHRTTHDVDSLLPLKPSIRLVKGAYSEPSSVAITTRERIDENYLTLAQKLLRTQKSGAVRRAAFATHDPSLIRNITEFADSDAIAKHGVEVQMLYGIQRAEQERLAKGGWRAGVLIAYGNYWYPWFVRRLAERPANLWLLLRNLAGS